jgi:uncharacterized protein (TIGR02271 family)
MADHPPRPEEHEAPGDVNEQLPGSDTVTDRITLAEETLEAHVVERQIGQVRIHTRVETEPVSAQVTLHHDDVTIERVAVNEPATERRAPWYEGETLMVPVYEEVLVTQTQLMLREVIQLRNQGRVEPVDLQGTVRREVVDIEEVDL